MIKITADRAWTKNVSDSCCDDDDEAASSSNSDNDDDDHRSTLTLSGTFGSTRTAQID